MTDRPEIFSLNMDSPLAEGLCLESLDKSVLIGTIKNQREEILKLRAKLDQAQQFTIVENRIHYD